MNCGRIYAWHPDPEHLLGGRVEKVTIPLPDLSTDSEGRVHLFNRFVRVRNAGWMHEPDPLTGSVRAVPIGDARPDPQGDFLFEAGRGGGRMDKTLLADPDFRGRYEQASHFGEVNTYYHLTKLAAYIDDLLVEAGAPSLPQVTAVVNAHHAATEREGIRDGVMGTRQWLPFQGGHYRLPGRRYNIPEFHPIQSDGEIHLGPGWQLLDAGALVEAAGCRYRANASHNAGILYHEYGHHLTRHTADFRANRRRPADRQDNRKTALDEGTCDYWAATMMNTPHIWAWHRRHDSQHMHPRNLASAMTMDDVDASANADAHANGTVWGAALWDLRAALSRADPAGARKTDLLVLKTLLLLGQTSNPRHNRWVKELRQVRSSCAIALATLLRADELLYSGQHRQTIMECFRRRRIYPDEAPTVQQSGNASVSAAAEVLTRVPRKDIPSSEDLCSAAELESYLRGLREPSLSVLAVGDIMLGERTRKVTREEGPDYPFMAVLPLLRHSAIVFANLEGPFAKRTKRVERNYSYRVDPRLATALTRANINVVTLANNHLMDCGRAGVLETLETLSGAGVATVGAAACERAAHEPTILQAGRWRVGMLGYYWNRRTAAEGSSPGSARDTPEDLAADIGALRKRVDRIVVAFHWGIPYEPEPLPEDQEKARFAVDCGADVIIGHHPHVMQPMEVYRGCPIFYSVGNFTFGSGNSRAEGLMAGVRFDAHETVVQVYPLYVKNRDPRVHYQPKLMRGAAARSSLQRLADLSAIRLTLEDARAVLCLPYPGERGTSP